ncbi:MAG: 23S rRNA (uracil(1939)-C(5))-methyltransferase RlmD [Clostridia bacterium]|nr:23S rRNA (uracil(1939)-C(5))-methyltransferase RlmD [Clostridia bacterium]
MNEIRKNETYEIEITDLNNLGYGVGRIFDLVVFVSGAVDGDLVSAKIIKITKSYAVGRLEKLLRPSVYRLPSPDPCPARGCGGCAYRAITYAHELELKRGAVAAAFRRAGLSDVTVLPVLSTGKTAGYRNKAQYPVTGTCDEPVIGFFAPKSHRVTDARRCPLQPAVFSEILDEIAREIKEYKITPYDEETHTGLLRHLYLRSSKDEKEVLLTFVLNGETLPHAERVIRELTERFPALVGIGININREKTNVICGEEYKTLWGRDEITDELAGVTLSFSAASFYQVNRDAAELLYGRAKEIAGFTGDELLLDLFCGVGSIGLSMADAVRQVVGIEIVPDAVRCANENAKRNGIANAAFFADDATNTERLLAGVETAQGKPLAPDAVILDPPRKGCDEKLLSFLAGRKIPKIVYISCNPETLARDAAVLTKRGYALSEISPVDLFPRTAHVEAVVRLTLRDAK